MNLHPLLFLFRMNIKLLSPTIEDNCKNGIFKCARNFKIMYFSYNLLP